MASTTPSSAAPEAVPSGAHCWLVLSRCARAVGDRARDSIGESGLGTTDFAILEALLNKGPMPVNTIGRRLLLTSGSITVAVDRLVAKGYVARNDHPGDRRVRVVELTQAGRDQIVPAFARHEKDLEDLLSALTPAERTTLVDLLRKLGRAAARNESTVSRDA